MLQPTRRIPSLDDPTFSITVSEQGSEFMKQDYLQLRPQRVAMQDASAQYAFRRSRSVYSAV